MEEQSRAVFMARPICCHHGFLIATALHVCVYLYVRVYVRFIYCVVSVLVSSQEVASAPV